MTQPTPIHISAGGEGSRIRQNMVEMGYSDDYPKHLLPTGRPNGETLLGRITRQALLAPNVGQVTIHASAANFAHINAHPDIDPQADVVLSNFGGSLGPVLQPYLEDKTPVISASGDFYIRPSWTDILDFHESHDLPVTYLVGTSPPALHAAVFKTEGDVATDWERTDGLSQEEDLVNVGLYLFKPHQGVREIFEATATERHEPIVDMLISQRLLAIYSLRDNIYNVNNPAIYSRLLRDNQAVDVSDLNSAAAKL